MNFALNKNLCKTLIVAMLLTIVAPPTWAQGSRTHVTGHHTASISNLRGKVEVKPIGQDKWSTARKDQQLRTGDRVKTGAGAAAQIKISDVGLVRIAASSEVTVGDLKQVKTTARAFLMFQRTIVRDDVGLDLKEGNMRSQFNRQEGRVGNYNVYTPVAVAGVRGTLFELDLDDRPDWYEQTGDGKGQGSEELLKITVAEGEVELGGPNWTRSVKGGQTLQAQSGSVPGQAEFAPAEVIEDITGTFRSGGLSSDGFDDELDTESVGILDDSSDTDEEVPVVADDFDTTIAVSELTLEIFERYQSGNQNSFIELVSPYFSGLANGKNQLNYATLLESLQYDFRAMSRVVLDPTVASITPGNNGIYIVDVKWNGRFTFTSTGSEVQQTNMSSRLIWNAESRDQILLYNWTGSSPFGLSDPLSGTVIFSTSEGTTSVDGTDVTSSTSSDGTLEVTDGGTITNSTTGTSGTTTSITTTQTVTGDIVVPVGSTFDISSGVAIDVQGPFQIIVEGTLNANGATFTGTGWKGIVFRSGSTGSILNSTIQNADIGVTVIGSSPQITGNTFSSNAQVMRILSGNPLIQNNSINVASPGVVIEGGAPSIDGNQFNGSGSADPLLSITGSASPSIQNNSFQNGGGILISSNGTVSLLSNSLGGINGNAVDVTGGATVSASNLTVSGASSSAVRLQSGYSGSFSLGGSNSLAASMNGITFDGGSLSVSGNTTISPGASDAGIDVGSSASGASIDGVSISSGAEGIFMDAAANVTISNSTVSGPSIGVLINNPGATVTLNGVTITSNTNRGATVTSGNVTFASSTISNGGGVLVNGGNLTLRSTTISSNSIGVSATSGTLNLDGSSGQNTIQNNTGTGIEINGAAVTTSSFNQVANNGGAGNFVVQSSAGTVSLADLTISGGTDGLVLNGGGPFTVSNSNISSSGGTAIKAGPGASSVSLTGVTVTSGSIGIDLSNSGGTLTNVSVSGTTNGVDINSASSFTIDGGTYQSNSTGIDAGGGSSVSIINNAVISSNNIGIFASDVSTLTLNGVNTSSNGTSLKITSPGGSITLQNSSFSPTTDGIHLTSASGATVTLSGVTVNAGSGRGIAVEGGSITLTGTNTVNGGTSAGIYFSGIGGGDISGVTIQGAGGPGVHANNSANITMNGGVVTGRSAEGIRIDNTATFNIINADITNNSSYGVARSTAIGAGNVTLDGVFLGSNNGQTGADMSSTDATGSPSFKHGTSANGGYNNLVEPPDKVTNPAAS